MSLFARPHRVLPALVALCALAGPRPAHAEEVQVCGFRGTNDTSKGYLDCASRLTNKHQLQGIEKFTKLHKLELNPRTRVVDDSSLARIAPLGATLETLYLGMQPVTAEGLKHLEGFAKLRDLGLAESTADDASLASIGKIKTLRVLNLNDSAVTGPGLVHLAGMPELKWLRLKGLPIEDAHLKGLTGLPKLELIVLEGTQVTDAGAEWLQSQYPMVRIQR
jgi:hypothetical protein